MDWLTSRGNQCPRFNTILVGGPAFLSISNCFVWPSGSQIIRSQEKIGAIAEPILCIPFWEVNTHEFPAFLYAFSLIPLFLTSYEIVLSQIPQLIRNMQTTFLDSNFEPTLDI